VVGATLVDGKGVDLPTCRESLLQAARTTAPPAASTRSSMCRRSKRVGAAAGVPVTSGQSRTHRLGDQRVRGPVGAAGSRRRPRRSGAVGAAVPSWPSGASDRRRRPDARDRRTQPLLVLAIPRIRESHNAYATTRTPELSPVMRTHNAGAPLASRQIRHVTRSSRNLQAAPGVDPVTRSPQEGAPRTTPT
jgi:hypothetical protein